MRVYPSHDINIYNFKIKYNKYILKKDKSKIMLTDNGFLKNINNELYLYKFNFKQKSKILKNYINKNNFILTPDKWIKIDKTYQLPVVHKIIDSNILTYTIRKNAPVKFVFEYVGDKLNDYYFIVPEDYEMDLHVKEDICSFLTKLH
jgi:hypothetical protein